VHPTKLSQATNLPNGPANMPTKRFKLTLNSPSKLNHHQTHLNHHRSELNHHQTHPRPRIPHLITPGSKSNTQKLLTTPGAIAIIYHAVQAEYKHARQEPGFGEIIGYSLLVRV